MTGTLTRIAHIDLIQVASGQYFPDKVRFTSGKKVVCSTAILETRAVLELTSLVPQLCQVTIRLSKIRKSTLDLEQKRNKRMSTNIHFTHCFLLLKMAATRGCSPYRRTSVMQVNKVYCLYLKALYSQLRHGYGFAHNCGSTQYSPRLHVN